MFYDLYLYIYTKINQTRQTFHYWFLVYQINDLKSSKDVINIITGLKLDTIDEIITFLSSFFRIYGCYIKESTIQRLNELRKAANGLHNNEEYAIILLWSCIVEVNSQHLIDFQ